MPYNATDDDLKKVAAFRSRNRIPVSINCMMKLLYSVATFKHAAIQHFAEHDTENISFGNNYSKVVLIDFFFLLLEANVMTKTHFCYSP